MSFFDDIADTAKALFDKPDPPPLPPPPPPPTPGQMLGIAVGAGLASFVVVLWIVRR